MENNIYIDDNSVLQRVQDRTGFPPIKISKYSLTDYFTVDNLDAFIALSDYGRIVYTDELLDSETAKQSLVINSIANLCKDASLYDPKIREDFVKYMTNNMEAFNEISIASCVEYTLINTSSLAVYRESTYITPQDTFKKVDDIVLKLYNKWVVGDQDFLVEIA